MWIELWHFHEFAFQMKIRWLMAYLLLLMHNLDLCRYFYWNILNYLRSRTIQWRGWQLKLLCHCDNVNNIFFTFYGLFTGTHKSSSAQSVIIISCGNVLFSLLKILLRHHRNGDGNMDWLLHRNHHWLLQHVLKKNDFAHFAGQCGWDYIFCLCFFFSETSTNRPLHPFDISFVFGYYMFIIVCNEIIETIYLTVGFLSKTHREHWGKIERSFSPNLAFNSISSVFFFWDVSVSVLSAI